MKRRIADLTQTQTGRPAGPPTQRQSRDLLKFIYRCVLHLSSYICPYPSYRLCDLFAFVILFFYPCQCLSQIFSTSARNNYLASRVSFQHMHLICFKLLVFNQFFDVTDCDVNTSYIFHRFSNSRFDLIFLILDPQDEVFDRKLANHLVSLYYQGTEELEMEYMVGSISLVT